MSIAYCLSQSRALTAQSQREARRGKMRVSAELRRMAEQFAADAAILTTLEVE